MDVVETNDKICYHFDLPGVADKEDINLSVDNNVLRMNCDKPQVCCLAHTPEERMNLAYHRHERSWGKYDRYVLSIALLYQFTGTSYHLSSLFVSYMIHAILYAVLNMTKSLINFLPPCSVPRSVRIPSTGDIAKISSCYRNGVLTVSIEKFPKESATMGGMRKLQIT